MKLTDLFSVAEMLNLKNQVSILRQDATENLGRLAAVEFRLGEMIAKARNEK